MTEQDIFTLQEAAHILAGCYATATDEQLDGDIFYKALPIAKALTEMADRLAPDGPILEMSTEQFASFARERHA
jgi:hypothetical protein